ncbi:MAG: hypothetical protein ACQESV_01490 [Thermodesulfobacteriota bacterium]
MEKSEQSEECRLVDPHSLDINGPWFVDTAPVEGTFVDHMRRMGQIEPVVVFFDALRGQWRVWHGRKRVLACRQLGREVIAWERSGPETLGHALQVYLAANWNREMSAGQQVRCLRVLAPEMDWDALATEILPLLKVAPQSRQSRSLEAWLALESEWDLCLEQGQAPLECALVVSWFSASEQAVLLPFFQELRWSKNNALHFLQWLWEVRCRSQKTVEVIISELELPEIVHCDWSPKDRIQRLVQLVWQARYPRLHHMREQARAARQRLVRGHAWRLEHDASFERPEVVVSTRLRRETDSEAVVQDLAALCASPEWKELWRALDGEGEA